MLLFSTWTAARNLSFDFHCSIYEFRSVSLLTPNFELPLVSYDELLKNKISLFSPALFCVTKVIHFRDFKPKKGSKLQLFSISNHSGNKTNPQSQQLREIGNVSRNSFICKKLKLRSVELKLWKIMLNGVGTEMLIERALSQVLRETTSQKFM